MSSDRATNDPSASAEADPQQTEQLVVMRLAGEDYGVAITAVREIIRFQKATDVPQAPPYVEGIINLRGLVIPVVDLRKRFGLQIEAETAETRIVVVNVDSHTVGLVVDGVSEVIEVPGSSIEPVSSVAGSTDTADLRGIANLADRLIILIDLSSLLGAITASSLGETARAA